MSCSCWREDFEQILNTRCVKVAIRLVLRVFGPNEFHLIYSPINVAFLFVRSFIVYRLKGIHSRSDTNRTGAEGLSFYYPRQLHCLNQMLAVLLLSQYRVSSSKTVRPRAPFGARCIGHAVSTWSAVCSFPVNRCSKIVG